MNKYEKQKVQGRAVKGGDANGRVAEVDNQENSSLLEQCHCSTDQIWQENHHCCPWKLSPWYRQGNHH